MILQPSPLDFFGKLSWIDGRPLLDTIEPYRQAIMMDALYSFDLDDRPRFNMVLSGRAKKNWKTSDLILAALYRFVAWESPQGNDAFILANDEAQAGDDLSLAKKLIAVNPILADEIEVRAKELVRRDGRGSLKILPARDAVGAHGKTFIFVGFDEIHGYRTHDLFEALAPDPTRKDALTWITSYAGLRHAPGIPLYDFMEAGKRGDDPRMYFSWYGGDFSTDELLSEATPEERANPSMASWGNDDYLVQQKRRLPSHKFRRLHLNLPGAPDGAFLDQGKVIDAIVTGRASLPPREGIRYFGFVDVSGGSSDDATIGISHLEGKAVIVDRVDSQAGRPPFNPRKAVEKFVGILREYRVSSVSGDDYGGNTFKADLLAAGISYLKCPPKSDLYEYLEPKLNAGEVELPDVPKMQEQLLTLVWKGTKVDHQTGDHDDWANAAAGAVWAAASKAGPMIISEAVMRRAAMPGPYTQHGFGSYGMSSIGGYSNRRGY